LRPGEKLSEQLWEKGAEYKATAHPDIRKVIEPDQVGGEKLHTTIAELIQMAENSNDNDIVRLLNEILPEAEIGSAPPPEFTSIA